MQAERADSRSGEVQILAGPDALVHLIERAGRKRKVTVGDGALRWEADTKSPGGTVPGDRIEAVTQHDAAFVLKLKSGGTGVRALTFLAEDRGDAAAWVKAVQSIIGTAPPTQAPSAAALIDAMVSSDGTPVKLTYKVEGKTVQKDYALLVIACDPRALTGICDYTEDEKRILEQFYNYTFHTTLVKVNVPTEAQEHAVVFAPSLLDAMDGSVYAYRNESAKRFGLQAANKMKENLVAVYQLADKQLSEDEFKKKLESQLKVKSDLWPFEKYEVLDSVTTPYFDHFENSSLKEKLPWTMLQGQGKKNTLLVHASACFESALHCWSYGHLLDSYLPKDKGDPIVILGAGVSGILFAARLKDMGYNNIDILENTDRYGGKTHTIVKDSPYPDPDKPEKTFCELGTCYLSPAYAPIVDYFKKLGVLDGNEQIDFGEGEGSFRGIVTTNELPEEFKAPAIMDYSQYVILKAAAELGLSNSSWDQMLAQIRIVFALAWYTVLHLEYMGLDMPMPSTPPPDRLLQQTFKEFLSDHGLLPLVGLLQYGYEVQGYGPLKDIPAYYGLVWITPAITWTILMDALKLENNPVVTAWSKGWGDVWDQMVKKLELKITLSAQTTSIKRSQALGAKR
jgi:hypothetical protein